MRKPEQMEVPSFELRKDDLIMQEREYRLITPLFGGGVKPGESDPVTIVRGTEVRGHLRFWWRATQGGRFNGDLEEMKRAEDDLWGTVVAVEDQKPRPSQVKIAIRNVATGSTDHPFVVIKGRPKPNRDSVVPAYAAFPLQPTSDEVRQGVNKSEAVHLDVTFTLMVSFPSEYRGEVEATLWAWETFAGLGARTRRGFGALQCMRMTENETEQSLARPSHCTGREVRAWLEASLKEHVVHGRWPKGVPHLEHGMSLRVAGRAKSNAIAVWSDLVNALRGFRQSRDRNQYGPTHWPEPNAIRDMIQNRTSNKSPFIGKKFPRAFFGLPIKFHFPQRGEPPDTTLKGKYTERMASTLILRPLACGNGGQYIGLAVLLEGPQLPPDQLVLLEDENKNTNPVQAELSTGDAKRIRPLDGDTNVLEAFLDTLWEEN